MDHVAHSHDVVDTIAIAHDQGPVGREVEGLSDQHGAVRQLDAHGCPQRGGVSSKLVDDTGPIAESRREFAQQLREQRVAVVGSPTLDDRRRRILARDRTDVDTDSDHDDRMGRRHVLREHAGQLARLGSIDHNEIVGPLREHPIAADPVDRGAGRSAERPHACCGVDLFGGNAQAHQERIAGHVIPDPVESPAARGLMVGDEDSSRAVAVACFGDKVGVGGPCRLDVAQGARADGRGDLDAHWQKAGC